MNQEEFRQICLNNDIILNDDRFDKISQYCESLKDWNTKINLVSRKDTDNLLEKHILHSLSILKYLNFRENSFCLDVGTGGGLPGIPLAIARQDVKFVLVDSILKKIIATEKMAGSLGLKNVTTYATRVEELENAGKYYKKFDYVISRSVANASTITGWVRNLLKRNGILIFFKGGDLEKELIDLETTFDGIDIKEIQIDLDGFNYFQNEEKKLLICSL